MSDEIKHEEVDSAVEEPQVNHEENNEEVRNPVYQPL